MRSNFQQRRQALGLLAGFVLILPAWGQSANLATTIHYDLTDHSTFQRGCFEPCLCPLMEKAAMRGTFQLVPDGFDGLYQHYLVANVVWNAQVSGNNTAITGSGTYRVGGEFAVMHQLSLDLKIDGEPLQHFDSGLIPGGGAFPDITIVVSIHGQFCFDTVLHVDARPTITPPVPRHALFVLDACDSTVTFSLFAGGTTSKLAGSLMLFLGDPSVPVINLAGVVGVSVDRADLVALDFTPNSTLPEPLHMMNDPQHRSTGAWYTESDTGVISLTLYLKGVEAGLPVPQPLYLTGHLAAGELTLSGSNGNIPDGQMDLSLRADEVPLPAPPVDVWFSTEIGFTSGRLLNTAGGLQHISDGDLLSRRGYIVRTNHQLTARLGIMPSVPDLGLDAVAIGPKGRIWFSFEEQNAQIWSETLGRWLKHGDLLSEDGTVVAANEDLLAKFVRMPPVTDAGLDAVSLAANREILFSTEVSFFSEALGRQVGHGDLLSNRGRIVMTNAQLLQNFHISNLTDGPQPDDYGLDAVVARPNKEFWFSTEVGFIDQRLGAVSDGDLLSTYGYVVARNLDLVAQFAPVEDVNNFGLDAAAVPVSWQPADFDLNGAVNRDDIDLLMTSCSGPAVPAAHPENGDLDGDGDIDQSDFGLMQRCLGSDNTPPDPGCAD